MKLATILVLPALVTIAACGRDSAGKTDSAAMGTDTSAVMAMPGDTTGMVPATASAASGMMDPNSAGAAEIESIPGVTPAIASAIIAGRPYASNLDLGKALSGLTEQQRDSVYSRLWTPVDVNMASDDEILLIPGVGARMLREFREYRPFTSIDHFRREIGKYVDDAELARLERFVVIR